MISQFIHDVKSISIQREKLYSDGHLSRLIKITLIIVNEEVEFEFEIHLFNDKDNSIKIKHNLNDVEMLS